MYKWILTTPLIIMTMVGMMVDSVRKMEESPLKGLPQTSKNIRGLEYRMHLKAWKVVMLD